MKGFYIAALNPRTGEFEPLKMGGISTSPENALKALRNIPHIIEEPDGFFHSEPDGTFYVILPLTETVCEHMFPTQEYRVFFRDRDGHFSYKTVKSVIDLTGIEQGSDMYKSLCEQLGATDISYIHKSYVKTEEIEFDVTR